MQTIWRDIFFSPNIKKVRKGKAVPEIASGDGAENETVPEELKPSETSPKAKKGKKKNAKNVQEEASTSDVKPAADEEAMASENIAIPEESEPSKEAVEAVPEITGGKEAENETVPEEPSEPSAPTAKPKKGKKKNAKIVQEEASTSDVKPAADESQIVSIPKESEGDAEIESVPTPPEPSPKAKKGKKIAKNAPEKKGKKKNVVAEEVIEDVDTNEAVSAKDPEGKFLWFLSNLFYKKITNRFHDFFGKWIKSEVFT